MSHYVCIQTCMRGINHLPCMTEHPWVEVRIKALCHVTSILADRGEIFSNFRSCYFTCVWFCLSVTLDATVLRSFHERCTISLRSIECFPSLLSIMVSFCMFCFCFYLVNTSSLKLLNFVLASYLDWTFKSDDGAHNTTDYDGFHACCVLNDYCHPNCCRPRSNSYFFVFFIYI